MSISTTLVRKSRLRRGWPWALDTLAVILFLGLGVGVVLQPYVAGYKMPGSDGDPRFNLALLEFFYRSLVGALHGDLVNFQNAPFFYPWPDVTNFSDTFWGNAEVYAVARALGAGQLTAFRIWIVAGFALTYTTAFVSFRKFGLAPWGAATGAFLFTFALPMTARLEHAQLVYRLWVPPAVLAFDRFLTRQNLRAGAACILFVALQFAVSIYLGMFLCLLLAAYGVALCLVAHNRLSLTRLTSLRAIGTVEIARVGILLLAGLIVMAVVGFPYLHVQAIYGFRYSWSDVTEIMPRPESYLMVGVSKLWPDLRGMFPNPFGWEEERQLFPGLSATIAFVWFLFCKNPRTRQPLAAIMLVTVVILFSVTIYVGGHTLYWLIYLLPGFSAVRAVGRVILVMMLPLAVLFGMMIDHWVSPRAYRWPRCFVAVALSGFLVAECSLVKPYDSTLGSWQARLEAIEARLPNELPEHAVLAVATPRPGASSLSPWLPIALTQIDAELAAVTLGIKTLNGYSGNSPPTWRIMRTCGDVGDNIRKGQHFLVEHGLPERNITPSQIILVGFGSCEVDGLGQDPVLRLSHTYHFDKEGDGNVLTGDGFSAPESWGRWTDAKSAFLFFSLADSLQGRMSIEIDAITLSRDVDRRQEVTVTANGRVCGRLVLAEGKQHGEVVCPAGTLRSGNNALHFHVARPTRPIDLGINRDQRELGLGLKTLTLSPAE